MIFLDFDGVLFDTVREAYAVSVISTGNYKSIDDINFDTEHYENFKKLRYLISPAWNYKYLLEELEKYQDDLDRIKENFMKKVEKASKEDYRDFEARFFSKRSYLKKVQYKRWLRLNVPFPFLLDIKYIFKDFKDFIYIVTTKDKETVLNLLNLENIEFDSTRIFDKKDYEKLGSKKSIIKNLIKKNENNIFVDDSDRHIDNCSKIKGLKCFQPDWGYVNLNSKTIGPKIILDEINRLLGGKKNV